MKDKQIGGNTTHPANDKLWKSSEVRNLVEPRIFYSAEEKKEKNRLRNQRFYKARKAEYEKLKEETTRRVANNEMTQAEADAQLDKAAPGWYRTIRELQRKINEASTGSEEHASLRTRLNEVVQQNAMMAHQFQVQCQLICDLYCPDSSDDTDDSVATPIFPPAALQWPTTPSTDAYLRIIALVFPMSFWRQIDQPHAKHIRDCAFDLLHPDHSQRLDTYMDQEEKAAVAAVFSASATLVDEAIRKWKESDVQMAEWNKSWLQVQREIQQAYLPQSDVAPAFVAGLIFVDASALLQSRRRMQQNLSAPPTFS